MAQTVKNPPAMRETWIRSLGWEEPPEEGIATHSWRFLPGDSPWTEEPGGLSPWGCRELDMTEQLGTQSQKKSSR